MIKSGIYKITNIHTGRIYVGSAVNIAKRFNNHKSDLNNNKHDNVYLQRAWNKYWGICSFKFEVIELCEKEKLIEREQYWIDKLNSCDRFYGYNLNKKANSNIGLVLSEKAKIAISQKLKGRKVSPSALKNMRLASAKRIGVKRPPIVGFKISNALKGKTFSAEHKAKLSIARKMVIARNKAAMVINA